MIVFFFANRKKVLVIMLEKDLFVFAKISMFTYQLSFVDVVVVVVVVNVVAVVVIVVDVVVDVVVIIDVVVVDVEL